MPAKPHKVPRTNTADEKLDSIVVNGDGIGMAPQMIDRQLAGIVWGRNRNGRGRFGYGLMTSMLRLGGSRSEM
jgi:hypothetical protein